MKANRLLSELMLLQARGRVSTREVAARMEISQRTAHRDMEALCAAGIPVVALRGSQGGWELDRGWRTKVPSLDEHELRAMLMTPAATSGGRAMVAAAERALNKLVAAMPLGMQQQAISMRVRVHVDPAGWGPWAEDLSALPVVQEAVAGDRKLTFDYQTRDGRMGMRTVEPLGVVCKVSTWYLVAIQSSGLRTFRVSRMANAVLLAEGFERPANFDLGGYWARTAAHLESLQGGFPAVFGLPDEAALALGRWRRIELAPSDPGAADLPAGWSLYRIHFDDEGQALFVALGCGQNVSVREPRYLQARVRQEARAMFARGER